MRPELNYIIEVSHDTQPPTVTLYNVIIKARKCDGDMDECRLKLKRCVIFKDASTVEVVNGTSN